MQYIHFVVKKKHANMQDIQNTVQNTNHFLQEMPYVVHDALWCAGYTQCVAGYTLCVVYEIHFIV